MSDSSSSEDEINKRILQDSIDKELLTNDMFTKKKLTTNSKNSSIENIKSFQVKPSLRYIIEDEGHNHNFLKVTPEFQEYVAKHLFDHLESQIVEKKKKRKNMPENGDEKKGIRLFNSSTLLMGDVSFEPKYKPHKRKKHCNSDDEKLIRSRASETAVSPQQILNREEVKFWAKETKGKIVKVRPNKEGTFDVINDIS